MTPLTVILNQNLLRPFNLPSRFVKAGHTLKTLAENDGAAETITAHQQHSSSSNNHAATKAKVKANVCAHGGIAIQQTSAQ